MTQLTRLWEITLIVSISHPRWMVPIRTNFLVIMTRSQGTLKIRMRFNDFLQLLDSPTKRQVACHIRNPRSQSAHLVKVNTKTRSNFTPNKTNWRPRVISNNISHQISQTQTFTTNDSRPTSSRTTLKESTNVKNQPIWSLCTIIKECRLSERIGLPTMTASWATSTAHSH